MSEKATAPADVVKLDVETLLQTTEGRGFLNQLSSVSHILTMKNSSVEFKGEEVVKTGYLSDCKSVQLFKCPGGYFIFCNKTHTKNNWSASGSTLEEVIAQINDAEIKKAIDEKLTEAA